LLRANAEALSGGDNAQTSRIMLRAWAVAHGLAMLILDGHLPPDDTLIDSVISEGLRGVAASPS
jgi:hypothetical protein